MYCYFFFLAVYNRIVGRIKTKVKKAEIEWYPFPQEKPKVADEYLVTVTCGYFNISSTSTWKDGKFTDYENEPQKIGSIIAWAEMPEPYYEE